MSEWYIIPKENDLMHYGVLGMRWKNKKPNKYDIARERLKNKSQLKNRTGSSAPRETTKSKEQNKTRSFGNAAAIGASKGVTNVKNSKAPLKFKPAYSTVKSMLDGKTRVNLAYIKRVYGAATASQRKEFLKLFNKYPASRKIMKQLGLKTSLDLTFGPKKPRTIII